MRGTTVRAGGCTLCHGLSPSQTQARLNSSRFSRCATNSPPCGANSMSTTEDCGVQTLELESEYWQLIMSGVGSVEACKIVGIGPKTGYRLRAENGGRPPARVSEDARSGRYLSLLERQRIAAT